MAQFVFDAQFLSIVFIGLTVSLLVFEACRILFPSKKLLDVRVKNLSAAFSSEDGGLFDKRRLPIPLFKQLLRTVRNQIQKRVQNIAGQNVTLNKRMLAAGIRVRNGWIYLLFAKLVLPIAAIGLTLFYDISYSLFATNPQIYFFGIALLPLVLFFLPDLWLRLVSKTRSNQIRSHWQDALDLLIICLEAGLTMEAALRRVSQETVSYAPALAEELVITISELTVLPERRQAYANLSKRVDIAPVRATVVVLIQAEQQGASVSRSLRTIATANRQDIAAEADRKAASLSAKMTIPLIAFFLPVIFVIILSPIYIDRL